MRCTDHTKMAGWLALAGALALTAGTPSARAEEPAPAATPDEAQSATPAPEASPAPTQEATTPPASDAKSAPAPAGEQGPDPRRKPVTHADTGPQWVEDTWQLELEGGFGYAWSGDDGGLTGMVRLKGGLLWIREPWLFSLTASTEWRYDDTLAFGVHGEVLNLWHGLWASAGAMIDLDARPGGQLSVGYSIVGVEAQVHQDIDAGETEWVLMGKVKIPIRMIILALR